MWWRLAAILFIIRVIVSLRASATTTKLEYNKARQLYSYKKDGGAETIFTYGSNGSRTGPGWGLTDGQDRLPSSPSAFAYTYQANGELSTKTAST